MNPRGLGGAYQGALEATLAVVISVLFGVWLDTKLDTSPAFLFTGLGVGFGAFILRLTRLLREVGAANDDKGGGANDAVPPAGTKGTTSTTTNISKTSGPDGNSGGAPQTKPRAQGEQDSQRDKDL